MKWQKRSPTLQDILELPDNCGQAQARLKASTSLSLAIKTAGPILLFLAFQSVCNQNIHIIQKRTPALIPLANLSLLSVGESVGIMTAALGALVARLQVERAIRPELSMNSRVLPGPSKQDWLIDAKRYAASVSLCNTGGKGHIVSYCYLATLTSHTKDNIYDADTLIAELTDLGLDTPTDIRLTHKSGPFAANSNSVLAEFNMCALQYLDTLKVRIVFESAIGDMYYKDLDLLRAAKRYRENHIYNLLTSN